MKLKYNLSYIDIDNVSVAIPEEADENSRCVLHLNETSVSILKALENDVNENEIVSKLKNEYNATDEQICYSVQKVLTVLREKGLITE